MEEFLLLLIIIAIILIIICLSNTSQLKDELRQISQQLRTLKQQQEKMLPDMKQPVSQPESTVPIVPPPPPVPPIPPVPPVPKAVTTPVPVPVPEIEEEIVPVVPETTREEIIPVVTTEPEVVEENIVIETEVVPEPEPVTYISEEKKEEQIPPPVVSEKVPPHIPPVEKENSFLTQLWGENLLSKIGIVTFVLGIAFFVKYAIDKDWINEVGRVGIGLLVGAIIIGVAHTLRKQYTVFSSILAGGGFAVFYITITLAFREYELIPQSVAFILLIIVTIACVLLSLLYDKKELTLFSLLGGFAAPFLVSTGSGNYIVLFSYILLLNCGMIWIAFRKNWQIISICSFILSQIVIWVWLISDFENQYIGVITFLALFFIQFHIMAVADHLKKGEKITTFQAMIILWNNILMFIGALYIFQKYPVDLKGVITITLAVFNAIALFVVYRNKRTDRNLIYLLIATVLTLVTLAIPIQLKGNVITLFWAAEMVILLVLWLQSRINIFRIGFIAVIVLVLGSYLLDLFQGYGINQGKTDTLLTVVLNRYFITGIAVAVASLASALILKRNNYQENRTDEEQEVFKTLRNIFTIILYVVSFLTIICELNYQLSHRIPYGGAPEFKMVTLLTFIFIYLIVVIAINKKQLSGAGYAPMMLLAVLIGYNLIYYLPLTELRSEAYLLTSIPVNYFYIHLLSLPAIGYAIYQMSRYALNNQTAGRSGYLWVLAIGTILIFTWETDNIAIMLAGNPENYYDVLHDIHTFGYPILWGLLAMGMMIWGLKIHDFILRKISLAFFAFIIAKFYLYDVWRMSQGGRILSFVVLGLILLIASFMLQRIKKLVKEDTPETNPSIPEENENDALV